MATNTLTTATAIDEWLQFCQETLMDEEDNDRAATPTEGSFDANGGFMGTPAEANMNPTNTQLSPKCINLSKPIRRRSRVSKKTPITLLNANTSNFRSLVQKFTGCPSKSTGSFADHQRPTITLNFQKGKGHVILQNQSKVMAKWSPPDSVVTDQSPAHELQQKQKQLVCQPHDATFSQKYSCGSIFPSSLSSYQTSVDISDHGRLIFGKDINLQEITASSFTRDDHVKDGFL